MNPSLPGTRNESRASQQRAAAAAATLSVGISIALAAVVMTFGAVLLAYAVLRVQAPLWPPPGEAAAPAPWPWPLAATVLALVGSAALASARRGGTRWARSAPSARSLLPLLVLAATAGLLFIGVQALAWAWLARTGVRPDSGLVASVIYGLTIFHALHAGVALVALLPLVVRAWRNAPVSPSSLRAVAWFWHLVTALWLVVCVAVFVA